MLLDRLEGDKELFKEIVGMFLGDAPLQMEKIKQSLQEGNSAQVESQAHGLKGAAMNIGGNGLQAVAYAMEVSGKNGDLDKARTLMDNLDEEFARLKKALISLEL
jgi:HPt (histidine-containing phosphotransfer) domain-containing protein